MCSVSNNWTRLGCGAVVHTTGDGSKSHRTGFITPMEHLEKVLIVVLVLLMVIGLYLDAILLSLILMMGGYFQE